MTVALPRPVEAWGGVVAALRPLLAEVGDAKRVRVAAAPGSLAEQAFLRSWARLVAGEDPEAVALSETASAVARARLAGIDTTVLTGAGLTREQAGDVLRRAFDEVAGPLPAAERLRAHLGPLPA
ncbi:MAG: hypothetical protein M3P95_12825, partial [Actinomycetota bacterium]|nr:hypothetical protein [Actinomycetota bacterium]